jgi:hypothetical protein
MNAPTTTETELATLRAECDVLRLMVVLMLRREINSDFPVPEMGIDVWAGEHMAAEVSGLSGQSGTPEQRRAHLDALSRFGDMLHSATEGTRMVRDLGARKFDAILQHGCGDC